MIEVMKESEKFLNKILTYVDDTDKNWFMRHKADIKAYAKIYHKEQLTLTDVKRSSSLQDANKRLDEVDFFDLMQDYRMAEMTNQEKVVNRFEAVKEWIRQNYA